MVDLLGDFDLPGNRPHLTDRSVQAQVPRDADDQQEYKHQAKSQYDPGLGASKGYLD